MFIPPDFRSDFPSIALYSLTPDLAVVQVGVSRHIGWLLFSSVVYFLVPPLTRVLPAWALTGAAQLTLTLQKLQQLWVCHVLQGDKRVLSCTEGQGQRSPLPLFFPLFRNICKWQVCPCPATWSAFLPLVHTADSRCEPVQLISDLGGVDLSAQKLDYLAAWTCQSCSFFL